MTAQINDTFRYRKKEYSVAGISEDELFEPSVLSLKPASTCTACWRGYQAVFNLSGSRLVLDALHVNLLKPGKGYEREEGPLINGVKPGEPRGEHDWFNNHYEGLDYHLEYTGGLFLADEFIEELYGQPQSGVSVIADSHLHSVEQPSGVCDHSGPDGAFQPAPATDRAEDHRTCSVIVESQPQPRSATYRNPSTTQRHHIQPTNAAIFNRRRHELRGSVSLNASIVWEFAQSLFL